MEKRQTFGVIVTSRNIFPAKLAIVERWNIITKLDEMGFVSVILGGSEVPNGVIETYSSL